MSDIGIPNGLSELGYSNDDVPTMVAGAMPQVRTVLGIFCYHFGKREQLFILSVSQDNENFFSRIHTTVKGKDKVFF